MNRMKTMMLLAALTALFLWIGRALGGQNGLMIALIFAAVMNLGAYWFSDKIVLRMYRAQEVSDADAPELVGTVRDLAARMNMPMPKVYIIPEEAPNAFATGRNPSHAAVAATEGILKILNRDELEGVLGHEMGHVTNRDTLISTVAATLAGALSQLASMAMWTGMLGGRNDRDGESNPMVGLVGIIMAPIAASLIQLAISRSRELIADETGAKVSGYPLALASALKKLEAWKQQLPPIQGTPATAHLFIVNPFTRQGLAGLFSTHPPTAERVARLEKMAYGTRL
jgi:heat shock protein HtpX